MVGVTHCSYVLVENKDGGISRRQAAASTRIMNRCWSFLNPDSTRSDFSRRSGPTDERRPKVIYNWRFSGGFQIIVIERSSAA